MSEFAFLTTGVSIIPEKYKQVFRRYGNEIN